jgi:glycogen operon protein
MLSTLLFSHGAPMILAGDEFGRTQKGNNNAYAQDNEISWVDWKGIGDDDRKLTEFVRELLKLRKAQPLLRRDNWRDGMIVEWLNPAGGFQTDEAWNDPGATTIGLRLANDNVKDGSWRELLILFNAVDLETTFVLPEHAGEGWSVVIDTATGDRPEAEALGEGEDGKRIARLFPRSLMLLT